MDNSFSSSKKVRMFFFPYIAAGHLFPSIGIARFFARHPDVQVTIIATPKNVQLFQNTIDQDREAGRDIEFHPIELPDKAELGGLENFLEPVPLDRKLKLFMAIMKLKDPLRDLLRHYRPDCLVSDIMYPWSLEAANEAGVPRIVFQAANVFALCVTENLLRFRPHEKVGSDTEPFILEGLPDKVQFTRLQIPHWFVLKNESTPFFDAMENSLRTSYGIITNSYYDIESKYYEYFKNVMGRKTWLAGPVNLYAKSERRGMNNALQNDAETNILKWLDSKQPNSVVYLCFGSETGLFKKQYHEIAHGLEAAGHPFILVAKPWSLKNDEGELFPDGFEQRTRESGQGLVIKDWAPQLLILGHPSVGAFMTHCGWGSCLEGLSDGVPMLTWPVTVDHFLSESLLVDVLKVGFRVGNKEDIHRDSVPKVTVTRDQVEIAVKRMMSDTDEVQDMRTRAKRFATSAHLAVQECGSSFQDVCALIKELKDRRTGNSD